MLCKACREKGDIACPVCGQAMPAGRGNQCEPCYWRGLLDKRVAVDCATFAVPQMADYFRGFGKWLAEEVGENKAAITVNRYLPFFLDIEQRWKTIPDYTALLGHFGAQRLRRVLLPVRWMQASDLVVTDAVAREEDSNRRRISATLDKVGHGSQAWAILNGYHKVLMSELEDEKTTLRSIRLALTPAAALLLKGKEMERTPPDQLVLDAYLENTPGQRAAVSGFVRYLRNVHGSDIALPKVNEIKVKSNRKKALEAEMLLLMREPGEGEAFIRRWVSVALAYFHGLPKKVGLRVIGGDIIASPDDGLIVRLDGRQYWIPRVAPDV